GLSGAWSGPSPARIGPSELAAVTSGNGLTSASAATMTIPEGAVVLTSLNVTEAEEKLIERALEVCHGNRTKASELLGISVRTLRNKLNAGKSDVGGHAAD